MFGNSERPKFGPHLTHGPADQSGGNGDDPKPKPFVRPKRPPRSERNRFTSERPRDIRSEESRTEKISFRDSVDRVSQAVLYTAQRTFSLDEGFLRLQYALHTSVSQNPEKALIHLELLNVEATPDVKISATVERAKARIRQNLQIPNTIQVHITAPDKVERKITSTEINTELAEREKSGHGRISRAADFVRGPGTMLTIVESDKKGRKKQMEITEERAPLRAKRLRFVQSLLSSLPDIAEQDPSLGADPETRRKITAVANALAITAEQGLRKKRDDIYSSLKRVIADNETYLASEGAQASVAAGVAAKERAAYDRAILGFDRALQNLAMPDAADLTETEEYALLEKLSMLSGAHFDPAQFPTQMPRETLEKMLEHFRVQLREFADSVLHNKAIPRGGNVFKTFLGNIARPDISKRLLAACDTASRENKRYVPEAVSSDGEPVEEISAEDKQLGETLYAKYQQFDAALRGISIDIDGLRSALRRDLWEKSWPIHSASSMPTDRVLTQSEHSPAMPASEKAASMPAHIATLRRSIESWRDSQNLPQLRSREGLAGTAFASIAERTEQLLSEARQLQQDVQSLVEIRNNPEHMANIRTLSRVSSALLNEINALMTEIDEARAAGRIQTATELTKEQTKASNLLLQIEYAIDNEDWILVKELAVTVPKAIGLED